MTDGVYFAERARPTSQTSIPQPDTYPHTASATADDGGVR